MIAKTVYRIKGAEKAASAAELGTVGVEILQAK